MDARHTPASAVDNAEGIFIHTRCAHIAAYNRNVVSLPCQLAGRTAPVRFITSAAVTPQHSSFTMSSTSRYTIIGNRLTRHSSIAPCVSLSAMGSSARPRRLSMLKRRAIYPSRMSVSPDISSVRQAMRLSGRTIYKCMNTGIRHSLAAERMFGTVIIFPSCSLFMPLHRQNIVGEVSGIDFLI